MVILIATSFLKRLKKNIKITYKITLNLYIEEGLCG